jgi:hypothetical protein
MFKAKAVKFNMFQTQADKSKKNFAGFGIQMKQKLKKQIDFN